MLKIFNTLTKTKEFFEPINKNKINLYVCGVTVYDLCHIGHGRTFVAFDMIVRYLRHTGFKVKYVRNITDIDDKIILKSIKNNIDINVFTDLMIKEMNKDFFALGILAPDQEPRVTDYINDIIIMITKLIKNKHAYINYDGDVVFSVDSDHNYGKLSRQSLKSLKSESHIVFKNIKKNPLDFVLWKKSKKEEYSWDSPWGKGRPGWHIECSTINSTLFHGLVDIHGGGSDLLFPHHENERSQSISFDKNSKINFWMHTGVVIINNQKMSKSLGNVYLLRNILKDYNAEVLRYFFLSTHYRHPIYYSENNLKQAYNSLKYLYTALYNTNPYANVEAGKNFVLDFYNAMNDDFNTPRVFSVFFQLANRINIFKKQNMLIANQLSFVLQSLANCLGLLSQDPEFFLQKKSMLDKKMIKKIEFLINKRDIARRYKSWKEADKLRHVLMSLDIILEDLPNKTIWRKK
ncbi:cysteine--tRNA ligase [Buchnera aphidicola (Brachycaudus cardui)]|uniref:Cysteine--tRNA ligase n=1 Tax=Buchnera aphidicola (Brachycaudus cardui) TaxID=557993 RepID=A0A4D6Y1Z8_9GAMM|nr:cysteine--tRNA ligase [Buchnera aphidicola]QCI20614.1 cysteine--tRNA ligase [Buchnera aphidicola (Brachycaudus cardui)]